LCEKNEGVFYIESNKATTSPPSIDFIGVAHGVALGTKGTPFFNKLHFLIFIKIKR